MCLHVPYYVGLELPSFFLAREAGRFSGIPSSRVVIFLLAFYSIYSIPALLDDNAFLESGLLFLILW
jgi:hypothetical protein